MNGNLVKIRRDALRLVPIATNNWPNTYERIIVPVEPIESNEKDEQIEKPVTEELYDDTISTTTLRQPPLKQLKENPKNFNDGQGKYFNLYGFQKPSDGEEPNEVQPLHVNTKDFKKTKPRDSPTSKPSIVQIDRLNLHNLPKNPKEVPKTDWFDNIGNYNYGIHHQTVYDASSEDHHHQSPQNIFKSSFHKPAQTYLSGNRDGTGNLLYKSEIFYPAYQNNLHPPIIIYGDYNNEKPGIKENPIHKISPPLPVIKKPLPEQKKNPLQNEARNENKKDASDEDSDDYEESGENTEDYEDGDGSSNDHYEENSEEGNEGITKKKYCINDI